MIAAVNSLGAKWNIPQEYNKSPLSLIVAASSTLKI